MLKGLYKVEMRTIHGSRRGVLYFYDGKMMGGSSAPTRSLPAAMYWLTC